MEFLIKNEAPECVVLVHGTWAKNSPWTKSGSYFTSTIESPFNSKLDIARYQWSGKNRQTARNDAAKALVHELEDGKLSKYEGIHLIAHSHGGNVCIRAANCLLTDKILSITTLATPFIISDLRTELQSKSLVSLIAALLFVMIICALTFLTPLSDQIIRKNPNGQAFALYMSTITLGGMITWAIFYRILKHPIKTIKRTLSSKYDGHGHSRIPTKSIYYEKDEAFSFLNRLISPVKEEKNTNTIYFDREINFEYLFGILILGMLTYILSLNDLFWLSVISGIFTFLSSLIFIAGLLWYFFEYLISPILRYNGPFLGLGFDTIIDKIFLKFRIEQTPRYIDGVFGKKIGLPIGNSDRMSMLNHSKIYSDNRAISETVAWVIQHSKLDDNSFKKISLEQVAIARQHPNDIFSSDDYPDGLQDEGLVTVSAHINVLGHVTKCDILESSDSNILDQLTQEIILERAKFLPAVGVDGAPIPSTERFNILWRLPDKRANSRDEIYDQLDDDT